MNLFVSSFCPRESAQFLDDKRVGKLLMEANQLLSLAIKLHHDQPFPRDHIGPGLVCDGFAHQNHPVSIWVRKTRSNFDWTSQHAFALSEEFTHRFGKEHASGHRTSVIFEWRENVPEGPLTEFQNSAKNASVGVDMSHHPVPESYRAYLDARWEGDARPPKWTNRGQPEWSHY